MGATTTGWSQAAKDILLCDYIVCLLCVSVGSSVEGRDRRRGRGRRRQTREKRKKGISLANTQPTHQLNAPTSYLPPSLPPLQLAATTNEHKHYSLLLGKRSQAMSSRHLSLPTAQSSSSSDPNRGDGDAQQALLTATPPQPQPFRIFVRRNERDSTTRVLLVHPMDDLHAVLKRATVKLGLSKPAKRLFLENGVVLEAANEIQQEDQVSLVETRDE